MNLDSLSLTLSQITYLVANLSKKNYRLSTQELANLVELYGLEAERHLLRCLFSHVDFSLEGNKTSSGVSKDCFQAQLLSQECANLLSKPSLISLICYAFDHPLHQQKTLKPSPHLFPQLRKNLKLTPVQEVVFGLALEHSSNPDLQKLAAQFVKQKLPELISSYVDADPSRQHEGGLHDTTPEDVIKLAKKMNEIQNDTIPGPALDVKSFFMAQVLHLILTSYLNAESSSVLWKRLQRDFPRELVPVILCPLLYPITTDPMEPSESISSGMIDSGLASLVPDVGASFTASIDNCKTMLTSLTGGDLTSATVAHTVTAMLLNPPVTSTHSSFFDKQDKSGGHGSELQWNMEVFITAVKEMEPNLSWRDVVAELDNPKFLLKDRNAFLLLFSGLGLCFEQFAFPIELFYRRWNNIDGQYSLILQILKNSETFSFADYPFHPVPVDCLKASPDSDNKEIAMWRSQDLIEILLIFGDHHRFCAQVIELFKFPVQHCPDVLMLGLLQNSTPLSALRQELITMLIPTFLGIHPNSAVILHHAWNHPPHIVNTRPIIMSCMADWYLRSDNDQAKLARILDIAQDLKALTLILASQVLPFVIDLACLASRRGYLKLDKWLTDKIREHGESFISACVTFLQRRCPHIVGQGKDEAPTKGGQLPHETVTTILSCLQVCVANVSKELSDVIMQMISNCNVMVGNKTVSVGMGMGLRQQVGMRHRTVETFPDGLPGLSSSLQSLNIVSNLPATLLPSAGTSPSPFPVYMNQNLHHPSPASQVVGGVGMNMQRIPMPGAEKLGSSNPFAETNKPISKEIEDEANSYFQRIYNHPPHPTLSTDEVLEILKRFMESKSQRERDVFNCMLKNLYEEYQFFPQYPDKELLVTAQLFGGIIEHNLVSNYMALGLALRFVLDALRKPHASKMYYFGITALDRFKGKLKEYAKYCEHVAGIPHFREFPSHLITFVEFGLQSQEPPSSVIEGPLLPSHLAALLHQPPKGNLPLKSMPAIASSGVGSGSSGSSILGGNAAVGSGSNAAIKSTLPAPSRPSIANATNIDTLLVATEKEDKITPPGEALQDKVGFIFNNLSQLNLQTKCDELKDLMGKEHWPWMAQYLVLKRVTIEHNFHTLYCNLVDVFGQPELSRLIVRETFRNIRVLLRSDKGIANFSDRSLLKNLGHWLGMLTLAKNQPILMLDMDIKSLIMEAYAKGQQELLYVIPFIGKVMESCSKSKVFRPKNPWTMAVMNLLAELHREPDLKLNLKFEIEVLCKNLDLEVAKLAPTTLLKDPKQMEAIELQLSKPEEDVAVAGAGAAAAAAAAAAVVVAVTPAPQPPPTLVSKVIQPSNDDIQAQMNQPSTPTGPTTANTPNPGVAPAPVEPRFHVMDLNAASFSNLSPHLLTIPQIGLLREFPQLKAQVRMAVERAVQEWDSPVTERSIKIAVATTENIVRRDFSLDPDETRMRLAAHTFARCLTGSMAMITCRDHMLTSISTNLKAAFAPFLRNASKGQLDQADAAATAIAEANMELACAFIQKAAMEKAIPECDKRLNEEFEMRKLARSEGRRYCDPTMLTYQAERMPEPIRHVVGGVSQQRISSVYGECAKTVPGFRPLSDRDVAMILPSPKEIMPGVGFISSSSALSFADDEAIALFDKLIADLDMYLQAVLPTGTGPRVVALHNLRDQAIIARKMRDPSTAIGLLQKAVEGLLEGLGSREEPEVMARYRDAHLRVLKTLHDIRPVGPQYTIKNVTRCLLEAREDIRYNLDAFDCLLRSGFVNIAQYDDGLAQILESSMNYSAVNFAMQLVQLYLVDDRISQVLSENDLPHTINMLISIQNLRRDAPANLGSLIEMFRYAHDPTQLTDQPANGPFTFIHAGMLQVRNRDYDDSNLYDKTEFLLREWVNAYSYNLREQTKNFGILIQQMSFQGLLKSDDMVGKFLRFSVELCVRNCARATPPESQNRMKCYHTLDAFVRLVYLLIKHTGDISNVTTKLNLLNKTLGIITGWLLIDHDQRASEFSQMPYERLFMMLFLELTQPEAVLEALSFQIVTSFCHVLYLVRPSKAPQFAYAWLELVAHRSFITRIMVHTSQQKGWPMYSQLLTALFKFLAPFLRNTDLPQSVSKLYRGTLRVLLVLLHDFPEFLCDYHYAFCDVIPSNCIQMRNLILSAFPRNMRLPDPFTPNLKVDSLSEITVAPRIVTNIGLMITPASFRKDLDSYLKLRTPVTFLSELRSNLQVSNEPGMSYNTQLMNALVLYVGTQAIQHIRNKGQNPTISTIGSCAHMDIFQNLGVDLDTEGRYLFLNAIANQLRYPNSHTHYFSCLLLSLFAESNTESIQEQITRVLLERLIVNRPHPWGLLVTFIELIKNPMYKFWSHEFVHCAPEIEKLFESVARSCMVSKQSNQQMDNDQGEPLAV